MKNPLQKHTNRKIVDARNDHSVTQYMLVTPTHIYIGNHSFFEYAKPGDVLVSNISVWYSAVLVKNNPDFSNKEKRSKPNRISWKPQKRPVPSLAAAFKAMYMNS